MEQKKGKRELTPAQKADLAMKYEIAAELGLTEKIKKKDGKD